MTLSRVGFLRLAPGRRVRSSLGPHPSLASGGLRAPWEGPRDPETEGRGAAPHLCSVHRQASTTFSQTERSQLQTPPWGLALLTLGPCSPHLPHGLAPASLARSRPELCLGSVCCRQACLPRSLPGSFPRRPGPPTWDPSFCPVCFVCFLPFPTKPFKLTGKGRESREIYHTHLFVARMVRLKDLCAYFCEGGV